MDIICAEYDRTWWYFSECQLGFVAPYCSAHLVVLIIPHFVVPRQSMNRKENIDFDAGNLFLRPCIQRQSSFKYIIFIIFFWQQPPTRALFLSKYVVLNCLLCVDAVGRQNGEPGNRGCGSAKRFMCHCGVLAATRLDRRIC